jgi:hypothetical protein
VVAYDGRMPGGGVVERLMCCTQRWCAVCCGGSANPEAAPAIDRVRRVERVSECDFEV